MMFFSEQVYNTELFPSCFRYLYYNVCQALFTLEKGRRVLKHYASFESILDKNIYGLGLSLHFEKFRFEQFILVLKATQTSCFLITSQIDNRGHTHHLSINIQTWGK